VKAVPLKRFKGEFVKCPINEATWVELNFPCILNQRYIPIQLKGDRNNTQNWSWNGDVEKPTLKPSIKTTEYLDGEYVVCHSFVNDGIVKFLSDCTHDMVNREIPLKEIFF